MGTQCGRHRSRHIRWLSASEVWRYGRGGDPGQSADRPVSDLPPGGAGTKVHPRCPLLRAPVAAGTRWTQSPTRPVSVSPADIRGGAPPVTDVDDDRKQGVGDAAVRLHGPNPDRFGSRRRRRGRNAYPRHGEGDRAEDGWEWEILRAGPVRGRT